MPSVGCLCAGVQAGRVMGERQTSEGRLWVIKDWVELDDVWVGRMMIEKWGGRALVREVRMGWVLKYGESLGGLAR